jgi:class 3 adenylate cyclase
MLAGMSEIDPRADTPLVDWSELSVSGLLPTGTVTLLLADVEGSTRLWETQPDQMTAALARMNATVSDTIATHGFSSHRARCRPTSPTSTPNSAWPPGCNSPRNPPGTPEKASRSWSSPLVRRPRVNTGIDRLCGDDGERCGQGEVVLKRFNPGGADDGGQCEGGFQHREVVADT